MSGSIAASAAVNKAQLYGVLNRYAEAAYANYKDTNINLLPVFLSIGTGPNH